MNLLEAVYVAKYAPGGQKKKKFREYRKFYSNVKRYFENPDFLWVMIDHCAAANVKSQKKMIVAALEKVHVSAVGY
jgi:hypothetical protein